MAAKKKISKQATRKKKVVKKKAKKKNVSKKLSTKERLAKRARAAEKSKKLSVQQEELAQAYIENGGNQSNAYRSVLGQGDVSNKTIWEGASRAFASIKVKARVLELMEHHKARHDVTIDSITDELDENREQAKITGNPAAMNQSTLGKAKIHGLMIEKTEVTGKDGAPLDTSWTVQVMQAKQ